MEIANFRIRAEIYAENKNQREEIIKKFEQFLEGSFSNTSQENAKIVITSVTEIKAGEGG